MSSKVLFILVICVTVIKIACISLYRVPYLHITYREVVANRRHLMQYVWCFTNKGACPPQATYIKRILPEIIKTNCSKCDPHLNEVFTQSMSMMKERQPGEWNKILQKYNVSENGITSMMKQKQPGEWSKAKKYNNTDKGQTCNTVY